MLCPMGWDDCHLHQFDAHDTFYAAIEQHPHRRSPRCRVTSAGIQSQSGRRGHCASPSRARATARSASNGGAAGSSAHHWSSNSAARNRLIQRH